MDGRIKKILDELKTSLSEIYGQRLRDAYLFGSYARDEADTESDIDILIVLDQVDNYSSEIDRSGQLISEISLRHGVSISRVFVSQRQWQESDTLFLMNVRDEAVPV